MSRRRLLLILATALMSWGIILLPTPKTFAQPSKVGAEIGRVKYIVGSWTINGKPLQRWESIHENDRIQFASQQDSKSDDPKPEIDITDLNGKTLAHPPPCPSWAACKPTDIVIPTTRENPRFKQFSAVFLAAMNELFRHPDATTTTMSKGVQCGTVTDGIAWMQSGRLNLANVVEINDISDDGGSPVLHFWFYPPRPGTAEIALDKANDWSGELPAGLYQMKCKADSESYWVLVVSSNNAEMAVNALNDFRKLFDESWQAAEIRSLIGGYFISLTDQGRLN